nr:hypothetical protein [Anaerolineae bacterium]
MPVTEDSSPRVWRAVTLLTILLIVSIYLALVPPGTLPFKPGSSVSDAAITHWPNAFFLRNSVWQQGQWPFWNPQKMLGQPFAANPLSKVWYPPQWLVLVLPPTIHLDILLYTHIAWMVLGVFLWMKQEGLHPFAAVFASLSFSLSTKLTAHLGAGHLDIVYALAWVPWLIRSVTELVSVNGKDKIPVRTGIQTGFAAAMLTLADLRIALYFLLVIASYGLLKAVQARNMSRGLFKIGGLALLVYFLLTVVQLVPLFTLGPSLTRATITPEEAGIFSLPIRYLVGIILPDFGGFHEWMTYLGMPVLVLSVAAFADRRQRGISVFWLVALTGSLVWALGTNGPLFDSVVHIVPVISWLRVPSRAYFVVFLAVTALSAYGMDWLIRRSETRAAVLPGAVLLVIGATVVIYALLVQPVISLFSLGLSCILTGAALTLIGMPGLVVDSSRFRMVGVVLLIASQGALSLWMAATLVAGRWISDIDRVDQAVLDAIGPDYGIVYSPSFSLLGPTAAEAGISTLHGVDPFQLQWTAELIERASGVDIAGYSVTAPPLPILEDTGASMPEYDAPDGRLLSALGVTHIVAQYPLGNDSIRFVGMVGDLYLYQTTGSAVVWVESTDAPFLSGSAVPSVDSHPSPNKALSTTVDTTGFTKPMILVIPQSWSPGWRAFVDDQPVPVLRVADALPGVELPPQGAHTVEVVYRPTGEIIAAIISGLSALSLLIFVIIANRGKRSRRLDRQTSRLPSQYSARTEGR